MLVSIPCIKLNEARETVRLTTALLAMHVCRAQGVILDLLFAFVFYMRVFLLDLLFAFVFYMRVFLCFTSFLIQQVKCRCQICAILYLFDSIDCLL